MLEKAFKFRRRKRKGALAQQEKEAQRYKGVQNPKHMPTKVPLYLIGKTQNLLKIRELLQ
jgi:hypothetical protein